MTLVDRNLHGLGEFLEHGLLAWAELVCVLFHVFRSDDKERLFIGVDIHWVLAAGLHMGNASGCAYPLAGELRDGAFLVTGLDGAHTGQILAKVIRLAGRHLRPYRCDKHQTNSYGDRILGFYKLHLCLLGSKTLFLKMLQTRYALAPCAYWCCHLLAIA